MKLRGHETKIPIPRRKLQPEEYDQALLWLKTVPGYRELIRERVSEAQKERRRLDSRVAARRVTFNERHDVDKLGREVEGCG